MIKYICIALLIALPAAAGDGHNHGDEAFGQTQITAHFDLTPTQIHNLDLKTVPVRMMAFFETMNAPCVVKKKSFDAQTPTIQAFVLEGIDISPLAPQQAVCIQLDAYPESLFTGKISKVDSIVDAKSRMLSFWIEPKDLPSKSLGLKGVCFVQTGESETALGLPSSAINGEFGSQFVFVQNGPHFERRDVALGHTSSGFVEIISGVTEGETVVTQGSYQLQYVSGTTDAHSDEETL